MTRTCRLSVVVAILLVCIGRIHADAPSVPNPIRVTGSLDRGLLIESATILEDEDDVVTGIARSSSGRQLGAITLKGKVCIYDTSTRQIDVIVSQSRESFDNAIAISNDGLMAASNSGAKGVLLWEVKARKMRATIPMKGVASVCFSPNGQLVAMALSYPKDVITICEAHSGQVVAELRGHMHRILGLCFSPDGKVLASGGLDRTIRLWNVSTHQQIARLESSDPKHLGVTSVTFSPDGKLLATTGVSPSVAFSDALIRFWDVEKGIESTPVECGPAVRSVSFSPAGGLLATSEFGKKARVWRVTDRKEVAAYDYPNNMFSPNLELALFVDGSTIAVAGSVSGPNEYLRSKLVLLKLLRSE